MFLEGNNKLSFWTMQLDSSIYNLSIPTLHRNSHTTYWFLYNFHLYLPENILNLIKGPNNISL